MQTILPNHYEEVSILVYMYRTTIKDFGIFGCFLMEIIIVFKQFHLLWAIFID